MTCKNIEKGIILLCCKKRETEIRKDIQSHVQIAILYIVEMRTH